MLRLSGWKRMKQGQPTRCKGKFVLAGSGHFDALLLQLDETNYFGQWLHDPFIGDSSDHNLVVLD